MEWRVTAVLGLLFCLWVPSAFAHSSGNSLQEYGEVTMDGAIGPGEYEQGCVGPITQGVNGTSYTFRVCEQNTEQNDFYAIEISDLTNDDPGFGQIGDTPMIWFDNDHSGTVVTSGSGCPYGQPVEDNIGWFFGGFWDGFFCKGPEGFTGSLDLTLNGAGVHTFTAGKGSVFEFSHPLDSGDPDDYSLVTHDTVGWCFTYDDKQNSPPNNPGFAFGELQFPSGCFVDFSNSVNGLVRGDSTLLGDVFKRNAMDDALDALKEKLKGLVATCKPCPPGPRRKLLEKVNEAIKALNVQQKAQAKKALASFNKLTKNFIKAGELPKGKAKRFLKEAKGPTGLVKKFKQTQSLPTTVLPGGAHANQITLGADGAVPPTALPPRR